MPIRPFLSDQAFDPELIAAMSLALEQACDALHLKVVDDIANRLVAEKIARRHQGSMSVRSMWPMRQSQRNERESASSTSGMKAT